MKSSELVARYLVEHIVENELPEGTVLAAEREMAESLEVGRATLREALRLLESRGVISIRKGARGGPVVRRPRAADVSEALSLELQLQGGVLKDVFEARELIECLVAERAAAFITPSQIEEIEASVQRAQDGLGNRQDFLVETQLFHHLLNDAAGNLPIQILNQTLHAVANMAASHVSHDLEHRREVVDAHTEILEAIRAKDAPGAVVKMRRHVRRSREYWNRAAGELGNIPVRWLQNGS